MLTRWRSCRIIVCLPDEEDPTRSGEQVGMVQLDRLEEQPIHRCGHFGVVMNPKHRVRALALPALCDRCARDPRH